MRSSLVFRSGAINHLRARYPSSSTSPARFLQNLRFYNKSSSNHSHEQTPFSSSSGPSSSPAEMSRNERFWQKTDVLDRLLRNNEEWRQEKIKTDPDFFEKTSTGQHPSFLWIGCSDSRVPVEDISGLEPGEVFVHRNIANMVVNNDMNSLSVLQYAVENLKVQDIVVCGHYGCGGVKAALTNNDLGMLNNWLKNIRDVCRINYEELEKIDNEDERFSRMVELNVMEQCMNIFKIGFVQKHQVKYGFPRIHGMVYDMETGKLNELDINFRAYIEKYQSVYKLHEFKGVEAIGRIEGQIHTLREMIMKHGVDGLIPKKYWTKCMMDEPLLFSETEIEDAEERIPHDDSGMVKGDDILNYFSRS